MTDPIPAASPAPAMRWRLPAGIALVAGMQALLLLRAFGPAWNGWNALTVFATPVCWWGYLLILDRAIERRTGRSWFVHRRRDLLLLILLSVAIWVLFEGYNVLMRNWRYDNLPADYRVRYLGYLLSFATILPGLFLTAGFLRSFPAFARLDHGRPGPRLPMRACAWIGALFCVAPPLLPPRISVYLFGFVWLGFILWIDPINRARGARSLFADWEEGRWSTTVALLVSGAICGLLWEFWNYWAYTRWVYTFPILQQVKIFEMPVAGFLGFPPFALEYFVLYHFVASFFTSEDTLGV